MEDQLQAYLDANKFYHFEGDRGVERLETVLKDVCGYGHWNTLHNFLADNPGAIEAIVQWIGEQRVPEWKDNLEEMGHTDGEEWDEDDGQPDEAQEWHDFDPEC